MDAIFEMKTTKRRQTANAYQLQSISLASTSRGELKFQISLKTTFRRTLESLRNSQNLNLFHFFSARNVCASFEVFFLYFIILCFAKISHLRSDFIFTYAYVMHTIWCDYERICVSATREVVDGRRENGEAWVVKLAIKFALTTLQKKGDWELNDRQSSRLLSVDDHEGVLLAVIRGQTAHVTGKVNKWLKRVCGFLF